MSTDGTRTTRFSQRALAIGAAVLAAALVAALVMVAINRSRENTVTVDFDRTVSLYEGSNVRILGVNVGTVEKITPRGTTVRVRLSWDSKYEVPADVSAVVVSPSVVGDRFVQLTPAYTAGATLKDGAHLDQSRTATPTELDETFAALDEVATTLGPDGVNEDGSLSTLLENSADNLDGKGAEIRESIAALAKLSTTADGSKDELFASMEKINTFVSALEANDASVRTFNSSLAGVSDVLADEGDDLQAAVRELAAALSQIQRYVSTNRTALRKNVDGLTSVTTTLAKQRKSLDGILKQGPTALANLGTAYNPTTGTLDTRATVKGSKDGKFTTLTAAAFVSGYCGLAEEQNPKYADACLAVGNIIAFLSDTSKGTGSSAAASAAPSASGGASLANLMGVS